MDADVTELLTPPPPVRILLVDDNANNLVALEAVLSTLGHEMVLARSGEEALRRVLEHDFALILMDGAMPGLDGFQTAALIKQRERTRDVPLIFVSAVYKKLHDAERGYAVGAVDYILKPFEPDLLRAKVAAIIADYRRRERTRLHTRMLVAQERRALAEQAARQAAETANRLKDEFIAMVSHELRTPLNTIIGWAEMLRSGRVAEGASMRAYESIHRNATLQKQLVEDLLDVSRITSGKLRLERRRVDLAELLSLEVESLTDAARAKEIALVAHLEPAAAVCDPDRIRQVVSNLVGNAIKFSPAGSRVDLSLAPAGDEVEIRVRDEGVGLSSEALAHIFEPFWQATVEAPRREAGIGLGLPIVRRLVELHGGSVTAASEGLGRGATFSVRIPAEAREPAASGPLLAPPEDVYPRLDGLRLLLVDDEIDARELLVALLEAVGASVTAVESVSAARAAIEARPFDLLIADLAMPDEDGFTLLGEIRAVERAGAPRLPAVALSAFSDEPMRARAAEAGFDAFIAKPFVTATLIAAVARHARRSTAAALA